ncbi:UNVERIFIED_CONTAM: hypothetical protein FKN15_058274 [Acipenser sinensis]
MGARYYFSKKVIHSFLDCALHTDMSDIEQYYMKPAVMCFVVTRSVALTCCAPVLLMGARYYFSKKVIHSFLDCALHTDMSDIEQYYMKPAGGRSEVT